MAKYPPFMNSTGLVSRILEKIKTAQTPDRFTQDFLATKLGFSSGSAKAFIPVAKRIGLLASDGSPTDLYKSFRNPAQSKAAMAKAVRHGYPELYERNEYAHELDRQKLDGLIMEVTGLKKGHATVRAIGGTFEALKGFADFQEQISPDQDEDEFGEPPTPPGDVDELGLSLSYTFNLVLPKTDDIAVFNAIFRSLRENLLRK